MRIIYDPAKREWTLQVRGLDFADAPEVFAGATLTVPDLRGDYGEDRYITYGRLRGRWWSWYGRRGAMRGASFP